MPVRLTYYARLWAAKRRELMSPEDFRTKLNARFIPATVQLMQPFGLLAYAPALLPLIKPMDMVDETALVIYANSEDYSVAGKTAVGAIYSSAHADPFTDSKNGRISSESGSAGKNMFSVGKLLELPTKNHNIWSFALQLSGHALDGSATEIQTQAYLETLMTEAGQSVFANNDMLGIGMYAWNKDKPTELTVYGWWICKTTDSPVDPDKMRVQMELACMAAHARAMSTLINTLRPSQLQLQVPFLWLAKARQTNVKIEKLSDPTAALMHTDLDWSQSMQLVFEPRPNHSVPR